MPLDFVIALSLTVTRWSVGANALRDTRLLNPGSLSGLDDRFRDYAEEACGTFTLGILPRLVGVVNSDVAPVKDEPAHAVLGMPAVAD